MQILFQNSTAKLLEAAVAVSSERFPNSASLDWSLLAQMYLAYYGFYFSYLYRIKEPLFDIITEY